MKPRAPILRVVMMLAYARPKARYLMVIPRCPEHTLLCIATPPVKDSTQRAYIHYVGLCAIADLFRILFGYPGVEQDQ